MPAPVTAGAAPVWTSNVQVSLAVAFITGVAAIFPKDALVANFSLADPVKVTGYANLALMGMSLASVLGASAFRFFSKFAPQVWSWAAAMKHPATQAVIKTQALMDSAGIPHAVDLQAHIEAGQAATSAHATADKHASADSLNYISPEVVTVIAKAVVAEIAARQAEARALHEKSLPPAPIVTVPLPPSEIKP
jgi:hypothetical protein